MNFKKESKKVRWIEHYNSNQKILLVGEGDFSFSACLARAFSSATNMVATSLDSQETLWTKHRTSEAHLESLKKEGCLILHEVDVHDMSRHPTLMGMKFDVIIYNFPHAGHYFHLREEDSELIEMHKELVAAFFESAGEMLSERGEVHVTHRDDYPYNRWKLKKLATRSGLMLKEKVKFSKEGYPGYNNKRGGEINSNKTFPLKQCFTFKFSLVGNSTQMPTDDDHQKCKTNGDHDITGIIVDLMVVKLTGDPWLNCLI